MVETVEVPCEECGVKWPADSPSLRLLLTCDDELLTYCEECWQREFGEPSLGRQ